MFRTNDEDGTNSNGAGRSGGSGGDNVKDGWREKRVVVVMMRGR